ncbi:RecB family exonuclease [Bacteroidota bacterium]
MARVESPSSVNTYKQCPRKYYYHYIEELPTSPSIHLIRGNIVHSVLEDFFDIDEKIDSEDALRMHLFLLFDKLWNEKYPELLELDMDEKKLKCYYDQSRQMLTNWFNRFKKKLRTQLDQGNSFNESVEHLTPTREMQFSSDKFKVRGFIDAIYEKNGNTVIMDYKTSRKGELTEEYQLQLGIYALMYEETKGVKPGFVGIDFMNHSELIIPVTEKLVENAKKDLSYVHSKTVSKDLNDYPQKQSPLCKWSTGQCDYYDKCFDNNESIR